MNATKKLWGVSQWVRADGQRVPWEISEEEMNRDLGTTATRIGELGIGPGDRVLITSMLSEAGHFWPITIGVMLAGAQLSLSDANAGEAVRVAMFTRLMDYRAAIGITPELLDGLDELGHAYADVFGGIALVAARPDAFERLVDAGVNATRFALVGPATAIASAPRERATVDTTEWLLEDSHGVAAVTNLKPRATEFRATSSRVSTDFLELPS